MKLSFSFPTVLSIPLLLIITGRLSNNVEGFIYCSSYSPQDNGKTIDDIGSCTNIDQYSSKIWMPNSFSMAGRGENYAYIQRGHYITLAMKSLDVEQQESETPSHQSILKPISTKASMLYLSIALALTVILPTPASAQIDINRGSEIFTGNCAGCHAGGMNFVKEKKTLKKEALEQFVSPDLKREEVQIWLMKSGQHQKLVFFKAPSGNGKLTEADWADVTEFVVDQAAGSKW